MSASSISLGLFISLLALAGCSTPYDLKKRDPLITYVSKRPAKEVKNCILNSWRVHLSSVYEEKTDSGYLVRYNDTFPAATVAIVTIEGKEPEVTVNYYHRTDKIKLHRLESEVKACR